jgi:hypothetical protein
MPSFAANRRAPSSSSRAPGRCRSMARCASSRGNEAMKGAPSTAIPSACSSELWKTGSPVSFLKSAMRIDTGSRVGAGTAGGHPLRANHTAAPAESSTSTSIVAVAAFHW